MTKKKLKEKKGLMKELMKDEGLRMVLSIFGLIMILSNAILSASTGNRMYFFISSAIVLIFGPTLFNKIFQ